MIDSVNREQIQIIQRGDYVWLRALNCAARVEAVFVDAHGFVYAAALDAAEYGHVHALVGGLAPAGSNLLH